MQLRLHPGVIARPFAAGGAEVESVGIRIDADRARLAIHYPSEHGLQPGVVLGEWQVRPDLSRGIAQPHGVDIASDDERVGLAVERPIANRGVERVGEAVLEEPGQFGIGKGGLDLSDFGLDGIAGEFTVRERWAAGRVGFRSTRGQGGSG